MATQERPESACCPPLRSEEHTSELQSQSNLVCRLLLEKKNRGYGCPERLMGIGCDRAQGRPPSTRRVRLCFVRVLPFSQQEPPPEFATLAMLRVRRWRG